MKCGDCGRLINPRRGYCTHWLCHNKMLGGPTPEARSRGQKAAWHSDKKRCPFCLGVEGKYTTKCYLSACDRGPKGRACDCHRQLEVLPSQSIARVVA